MSRARSRCTHVSSQLDHSVGIIFRVLVYCFINANIRKTRRLPGSRA
jgi:hypothetical protein